jgi:ABC-type cobalamin/Fe3+-siderophores transport system ATPase subunit
MMSEQPSFVFLNDECGAGVPIPSSWRSVKDVRSLVIVGLTGVGKTTVLTQLKSALAKGNGIVDCQLLPNRREVTDVLMIPFVQRYDGLPVEPVKDRAERFEITRRYRQLFAGGMAHALSQLSVPSPKQGSIVIFDGLRGENEIRHAANLLPHARFLMLDAPDAVRIERLVSRQDAFDSLSSSAEMNQGQSISGFAELGVSGLEEILTSQEQARLLALVNARTVEAGDLAARAKIVLAERRNYDPIATRNALLEHAEDRSLVVDTATLSPAEIVSETIQWLNPEIDRSNAG